jgi:hypothetical protein
MWTITDATFHGLQRPTDDGPASDCASWRLGEVELSKPSCQGLVATFVLNDHSAGAELAPYHHSTSALVRETTRK